MSNEARDIEALIRASFPEARITITDLAGDGNHWAAEVIDAVLYQVPPKKKAFVSPLLPPMMSLVVTKSKTVSGFSRSLAASQRGERRIAFRAIERPAAGEAR